MNVPAMKRYVTALREAIEAENDLMGSLLIDADAFKYAMQGRIARLEYVIKMYEEAQ